MGRIWATIRWMGIALLCWQCVGCSSLCGAPPKAEPVSWLWARTPLCERTCSVMGTSDILLAWFAHLHEGLTRDRSGHACDPASVPRDEMLSQDDVAYMIYLLDPVHLSAVFKQQYSRAHVELPLQHPCPMISNPNMPSSWRMSRTLQHTWHKIHIVSWRNIGIASFPCRLTSSKLSVFCLSLKWL